MQKIEKVIKKILTSIFFLYLVGLFFIEYTFNIDFTYQIFIVIISLLLIGIILFFYFKPQILIQKRKEIILLIFIFFLFFIAMEIVLNLTECERKYEKFPNEIVKYKHETNEKVCNNIKDEKRFYANSNNEGFIDDEFIYNNSDYNIFILGDSFAQCLQANYSNCVHQRLEKDLKEIYGNEINVMNFGIGGYGAAAELSVLQKYQTEYEPKMVILYFLAQNDLSDNLDYGNESISRDIKTTIRMLTPKTILFFMTHGRNIANNLFLKSEEYRLKSSYGNQAIKDYEVYLEDYNDEWDNKWRIEFENIKYIKKICIENNITLLIVAVTSNEQVYPNDWGRILETYPSLQGKTYILDKPNNIMMDFAEKEGIYHLDLLPFFKANKTRLHWNYDGHWNDNGQIFAEEKIKEYIIQNNLIK